MTIPSITHTAVLEEFGRPNVLIVRETSVADLASKPGPATRVKATAQRSYQTATSSGTNEEARP